MKLPNEVSPGQPISAKDFNNLIRYVRSLQVISGPGIRFTRTLGGTSVSLAPQETKRGITSLEHPFLVSNASSATTAAVRVRGGSVNDVMATGISPTDQFLTSAGTWRVYLDCTLSNDAAGTVTAVAVVATNGAQPANDRTHACITLATATVVAGETEGFVVSEITQLATHSLRFFACGRTESVNGTYNFWGF